jgi:hypothetical protein
MARKIQNLIGVRVERLHHLISGRSLAQFNTKKAARRNRATASASACAPFNSTNELIGSPMTSAFF